MTRLFAWLAGRGGRQVARPASTPQTVLQQVREAVGLPPSRRPQPFPNTFQPPDPEPGVQRPKLFDPALRHFTKGFRIGEPAFNDPETAWRWRAARRRVMDHVLRTVSRSPWATNLVLRGSVLLKAWLGDAGREPGDMDWVVTPAASGMNDPGSRRMLEGLVREVCQTPIDGIEIVAEGVAVDDIWTYERAPGRRVVFPWRATGLPAGVVQMDVVFGEELLLPPVRTEIPAAEGSDCPTVWAAGKELSLAWKILWLETDNYPQGKDLYDAVLLAEQTFLPADVLRRSLRHAAWLKPEDLTADLPLKWQPDWATFKAEYPWAQGEAIDWQRRLADALKPTFARV